MFDKLIELNHMNIVKFHGYWQDRTKNDDRPRVGLTLCQSFSCSCPRLLSGCFHHGVHVQWLAQDILAQEEKDQTQSVAELVATMVYSTPIRTQVRTPDMHGRVHRSRLVVLVIYTHVSSPSFMVTLPVIQFSYKTPVF